MVDRSLTARAYHLQSLRTGVFGVHAPPELGERAATSEMVSSSYQRIYRAVRRIPRGRVATYGQIAELAGLGGHARQVGYALHALTDGNAPDGEPVPWHRVIDALGRITVRAEHAAEIQAELLEGEGVEVGPNHRVDLARHRWKPRRR